MSNNKRTKQWIVNAVVAAIYVVLTGAFSWMSFGVVQFRLSEILNHLAVFNKKYIIGIVAGVFISNLLFSPSVLLDILFGSAHTLLALLAMRFLTKNMTKIMPKMLVNTLMFAVFSFIIAAELHLAFGMPFWFSYFTVALGEVVVMLVGVPIMKLLNGYIDFNQQMED